MDQNSIISYNELISSETYTSYNLISGSSSVSIIDVSKAFKFGKRVVAKVYCTINYANTDAMHLPFFKIDGAPGSQYTQSVGYVNAQLSSKVTQTCPVAIYNVENGYIYQHLSSVVAKGDIVYFNIDYYTA